MGKGSRPSDPESAPAKGRKSRRPPQRPRHKASAERAQAPYRCARNAPQRVRGKSPFRAASVQLARHQSKAPYRSRSGAQRAGATAHLRPGAMSGILRNAQIQRPLRRGWAASWLYSKREGAGKQPGSWRAPVENIPVGIGAGDRPIALGEQMASHHQRGCALRSGEEELWRVLLSGGERATCKRTCASGSPSGGAGRTSCPALGKCWLGGFHLPPPAGMGQLVGGA